MITLSQTTLDSKNLSTWVTVDPEESFAAFLKRNFLELIKLRYALISFVYNTLRRRYRRSTLGFAWSLLNPLSTMIVMTIIFSLLFRMDPRKYGVFIFTGSLPWAFIVDCINAGCESIIGAESFHKKINIPKLFFPIVYVSVESVNFTLSLFSLWLICLALGMRPQPVALLVPVAVMVLAAFNYGMAILCAIGTIYFRDLPHIIKIALGTVFYLTPIIYPLELIPENYRNIFLLNPFYHFISLFRALIMNGQMPALSSWLISGSLAVFVLTLALYLVHKKESQLVYRL